MLLADLIKTHQSILGFCEPSVGGQRTYIFKRQLCRLLSQKMLTKFEAVFLVSIFSILAGCKQEVETKGAVKNRTCEVDGVEITASGGVFFPQLAQLLLSFR